LQRAVEKVYLDGKHLTGDVGGGAFTQEFMDAVVPILRG
jgi:isocitrate/isopropylmalate dehydrogenase